MNKTKAGILIFLPPILWGSGFVVTKDLLNQIGPSWILVFRFGIAALTLLPFALRHIRSLRTESVRKGILIGILVYGLHVLQNMGLRYTTAGVSAFLTTTYVVFTPFAAWAVVHRRPKVRHIVGAVVSLAGVGLISLQGTLQVGRGEWLTIAGAVVCAVMFAATDRISKGEDVLLLTWMQMVAACLISLGSAVVTETVPSISGIDKLLRLVYLGAVVSGISFVIQNIGLKYVNPTFAALVFALESVFGCLAGVIFLGETVSRNMFLGCVLMIISIVISTGAVRIRRTVPAASMQERSEL